jgi:hypothetical protein
MAARRSCGAKPLACAGRKQVLKAHPVDGIEDGAALALLTAVHVTLGEQNYGEVSAEDRDFQSLEFEYIYRIVCRS